MSGVPGRNAAQVVIDDLDWRVRQRKFNSAAKRGLSFIDKVMQSDTGSTSVIYWQEPRIPRDLSIGYESR